MTPLRIVYFLGGAYAINDEMSHKNKIFIHPKTLDNKLIEIHIPQYSKLFEGISKINLNNYIVGTEFFTNLSDLEGRTPSSWKVNTTFSFWKSIFKWQEINYEAYQLKKGHYWDLSRRISHQLRVIDEVFKQLVDSYKIQLFSLIKNKSFFLNKKFENGYSLKIYNSFQHLLVNIGILGDYLSEFISYYIIKDELNYDTKAKLCRNYYEKQTFDNEFDNYFKKICSKDGWLNILTTYRNLIMHTCPMSLVTNQVFLRCSSIKINDNKELPRIIAPIPINPKEIKDVRNKPNYFKILEDEMKNFINEANSIEKSIDILEYSYNVMNELNELVLKVSSLSPLKGKKPIFEGKNIKIIND